MKSTIASIATVASLLAGCAGGPVQQGDAAKFPEQNLKWWLAGRVVPDERPATVSIRFEGVPVFTQRLSEAFAKAGYQVLADGAQADQALSIRGAYESHGNAERTLALSELGWEDSRDLVRERAVAKDAAVTTAMANSAVDAGLMGQWWGVGMVANSVLHSTGLAARFNNWVLGKGPRYKSGWSDQTIRLDVQDRRNPQLRAVIVTGVSSKSIWADQLLERGLMEFMRQYGVVNLAPPSPVVSDLTALQEAMSATEVE